MNPTPLPPAAIRLSRSENRLFKIFLIVIVGEVGLVVLLRLLGLIIPYSTPTDAMAPTMQRKSSIPLPASRQNWPIQVNCPHL